jgi:single-strand DNA-binding protein
MINKTTLIGRLTKDPDVRTLQNGNTVATFTLAVDRTFKSRDGEKSTDFVPIVAWGKTAELCEQYLRKGNLTGVCGRCQTRTYESKDGTNRFVMEVVAEEVSFLTPKKEQTQSIDEISEQYGFIEDDDMPF